MQFVLIKRLVDIMVLPLAMVVKDFSEDPFAKTTFTRAGMLHLQNKCRSNGVHRDVTYFKNICETHLKMFHCELS